MPFKYSSEKKRYKRKYDLENKSENSKKRLAWRKKNKQRDLDTQKRSYKKNPQKRWGLNIKNKFNLSIEEYNKILLSQNGRCAICYRTPEEVGNRLSIDHNHECCPGRTSCGKCIRGLLCRNCNTGIAMFADSCILLNRSINYLEK